MSASVLSGNCAEDRNSHKFPERQSILVLQRNSRTGCQICQLLFGVLQAFYGLLIAQHAAEIDFCCLRSLNYGLVIQVLLDRCRSIHDQCWRKSIDFLQIVYGHADRRYADSSFRGVSLSYQLSVANSYSDC